MVEAEIDDNGDSLEMMCEERAHIPCQDYSTCAEKGSKGYLTDDEACQMARRNLMRILIYTAPVVIGSFIVNSAMAQSCTPGKPCVPPTCGPRPLGVFFKGVLKE